MRLEDCEAKIDSAAIACNLEPNTVLDAKRATGIRNQLKESFSDISYLPTQTVLEFGKKKNKPYLGKVIPVLQKKMVGGNRPTRKEIVELFRVEQRNAHPVPEPSFKELIAAKNHEISDTNILLTKLRKELAALEAQYKQVSAEDALRGDPL